jgi:hypothetical protein
MPDSHSIWQVEQTNRIGSPSFLPSITSRPSSRPHCGHLNLGAMRKKSPRNRMNPVPIAKTTAQIGAVGHRKQTSAANARAVVPPIQPVISNAVNVWRAYEDGAFRRSIVGNRIRFYGWRRDAPTTAKPSKNTSRNVGRSRATAGYTAFLLRRWKRRNK